jgi:hypothetical protein
MAGSVALTPDSRRPRPPPRVAATGLAAGILAGRCAVSVKPIASRNGMSTDVALVAADARPGLLTKAAATTGDLRRHGRGSDRRRQTAEWLEWSRDDLANTRTAKRVAAIALSAMVLVALVLVSLAAAHPSWLSPISQPGHHYPGWLSGPLGPLTSWFTLDTSGLEVVFTAGVAVMYVAYVLVLICAPRIRPGWALAAVVVLQVIFFLSPPLTLTDVFNYLNYGRMEIVHGLNPYTTIPALEPHTDPTFALSNWHDLLSPYGPLFTILTFALVTLGVAGFLWALKTILLLASLGSVWLIWRSAGMLGRNRLGAALLLGLNPLVLVWGLGADHNDFLVIFLVATAMFVLIRARTRPLATSEVETAAAHDGGQPVTAVLRAHARRGLAWIDRAPGVQALRESAIWWEIGGGVALAGAVAVKASAAVLIPVVLAGSARRLRVAAGLLIGFVVITAVTLVAFGPHLPNISQQNKLVTPVGIPNVVGYVLGVGGETAGVRLAFGLGLVLAVTACTVWAWRTQDWLLPSACATLALLLCLSWSLPWYLIWLLPFAALTPARWVRTTVIVLGVYLFMTSMPYSSRLERHLDFNPRTTNIGRADEDYLHSLLY